MVDNKNSPPNVNKKLNWWNWTNASIAFATLIVTIVALIVGYNQLIANKKELKIYIVSQAPIVSVDEKYKNDLQIIYKGQEIKEAISTIYRIKNSGNQPIEAEDIKQSISFNFDQGTELINANVIGTSPKNIDAKVSIEGNAIVLKNLLINQKDSIDISSLTSRGNKPVINGRVLGIRKLELDENEGNFITLESLMNHSVFLSLFVAITILFISSLSSRLESIVRWLGSVVGSK